MSLAYRLRQLRGILLSGPLSEDARNEVARTLSASELALFSRLSHADQWHSYRVLRTLLDAGYNHPDLMPAALLHDIGKVRHPLSAWDRTVIVVGEALFADRTAKWGSGSLAGWQRPFVVRACHPEWGAEMAQAAGSRAGSVELIRRHQDKPDGAGGEQQRLLALLQWADGRN
ncbi:MAG TPA: HD domain-containing protein [Promineifilum sp.]